MRTLARFPVLATLLLAPAAVSGAPALTALMKTWRTDARSIHAMVTGRANFDAASIETFLRKYVSDAERVQAEITGKSADARDIKRRFIAFQGDAQAALGHVADRTMLNASVAQLLSDCKSCHDIYNK